METCPHCGDELEDDGISLRCRFHGPIAISNPCTCTIACIPAGLADEQNCKEGAC